MTPVIDAARHAQPPALAKGVDLAELDRRVQVYRNASRSPSTLKSYRFAWREFSNFLTPKDVWRASRDDVERWCAHLADKGYRSRTVSQLLAGLRYHYEDLGKGHLLGRPGVGTRRSPTKDDRIRRIIIGIRRQQQRPPNRPLPLMLESIEKMIDVQPDTIIGARNKAMLALGWAAARRPGEIVKIDVAERWDSDAWIEWVDDGLVVALRRSKANQEQHDLERYAVPPRPGAPRYCPVALVRRWLEIGGHTSGPLFYSCWKTGNPRSSGRLQLQWLCTIVQRSAKEIGIVDRRVSGQSLRAGCITWLYMEGVHPERILEQSGHRDMQTLMNYIRPPKLPARSPLALTRWVR